MPQVFPERFDITGFRNGQRVGRYVSQPDRSRDHHSTIYISSMTDARHDIHVFVTLSPFVSPYPVNRIRERQNVFIVIVANNIFETLNVTPRKRLASRTGADGDGNDNRQVTLTQTHAVYEFKSFKRTRGLRRISVLWRFLSIGRYRKRINSPTFSPVCVMVSDFFFLRRLRPNITAAYLFRIH